MMLASYVTSGSVLIDVQHSEMIAGRPGEAVVFIIQLPNNIATNQAAALNRSCVHIIQDSVHYVASTDELSRAAH